MSELHERHTAYELQEQYACERYWPVGAAAESWLVILIGNIIGQRISFGQGTQRQIEMICAMLDGSFDMERHKPKKGVPPPGQMKNLW